MPQIPSVRPFQDLSRHLPFSHSQSHLNFFREFVKLTVCVGAVRVRGGGDKGGRSNEMVEITPHFFFFTFDKYPHSCESSS